MGKKATEKTILWGLLFIVALISFWPITHIFLPTGDDLQTFLRSSDPFSWVPFAEEYAQSQGRFYFLLTQYFHYIPYLGNHPFCLYTLQILPIVIGFVLLATLLYRVTKNKTFGYIILLFSLSFFLVLGWHSAFISYPFYFSFSACILLVSFHFLISYFKNEKAMMLWFSALIYFVSLLFYEAYLSYSLLFIVAIYAKYSWKGMRKILPILSAVLLYIVIYMGYAYLYPSSYGGTSIDVNTDISLYKSLRTLWLMTWHSIPMTNFSTYSWPLLFNGDAFSVFRFDPIAYVQAFLCVLIFLMILKKSPSKKIKIKSFLYIVLGALLAMVLPHVLLSLTQKYSSTDAYITYVSTSFAYFGFILLVSILIYFFYQRIKGVWKKIYLIGICVLLFINTAYTQQRNIQVAKDMSFSAKRFQLIDSVAKKGFFKENQVAYLGSLHFTSSKIAENVSYQESPFNALIYKSANIKVQQYIDYDAFYQKYKDSVSEVSLVMFSQAYQTGDALLFIYNLPANQLSPDIKDISVDTIRLAYAAPNILFSLSIASKYSGDTVRVGQNNCMSYGNMHYANLSLESSPKPHVFTIEGKNLLPASLNVSNMLYQPLKNEYIKLP